MQICSAWRHICIHHYCSFLKLNCCSQRGGQVKRAAMEAISADGSPTFSRMSGIQEWSNAVALFVNVYGDGYKNVFLKGGKNITWFAQNRQFEGTPVVQRLVHSRGGTVIDEDGVRMTHAD